MSLALVHDRRDLPPLWDGTPVEWTGWRQERTTIILHVPPESLACSKCGAIDECIHNFGIRPPAEGATVRYLVTRHLPSGRTYQREEESPAHPVRDLIVSRCRHCGHDTVTDERTGECWDLDETDYGPEGSTNTDTLF